MRIKPFAAAFELSWLALGLMIAMLVVMWAESPGTACALSPEPRTVLVLSRQTDREHLASDLASVGRIAERYSRAGEAADQQRGRFDECEAALVRQIAFRHSVERSHLGPIPAVGQ
jgi:hypothetical protein